VEKCRKFLTPSVELAATSLGQIVARNGLMPVPLTALTALCERPMKKKDTVVSAMKRFIDRRRNLLSRGPILGNAWQSSSG
jgi:hypothetical protein